ncbi:LicD family protein [Chitinophaga sp. OAE865]|uniref:LicD family protein n=1 Tax=Chitinophaga sp. OAE865 TaxID=2817898 RepID=UPI001AEB19E4
MELLTIQLKEPDSTQNVRLDDNFMLSKYGFRISEYDYNAFITHYNIWTQFKQTDAAFCLIIEHNTYFNPSEVQDINVIINLLECNGEWDVLFPFEQKILDRATPIDPGYLLGYHWGNAAYFLSKKGVEKLLSISEIRQPLDEEILTLSFNNQLEVFNLEMNFFEYSENNLHHRSRDNAIRKAIFESTVWSLENRAKALTLLHRISHIATSHSIDLVLSDGSLLGHIRHGGIIPWDDDIDIALKSDKFEELRSAVLKDDTLCIDIFNWGEKEISYAKIWLKDGEKILGYSYKFPFVDIWFYKEERDLIIFDSGTVYPKQLYYPFKDVIFEGSLMKIPGDPISCLDISYPEWKTKIQVYPWSHRLEKLAFAPLSAGISVDQNGRIT